MELLQGADTKTRDAATTMAPIIKSELDRAPISDDRKRVVIQLLRQAQAPTLEEIAAHNHDARAIAQEIRARIEATHRDPAHLSDVVLANLEAVLAAALAPVLEVQTQVEADTREILQRLDQTGEFQRMRNEGITESAILRLASRIVSDAPDLGTAWAALEDLVQTALRVQQEGTTSNHPGFVDAVLERSRALAAEGQYSEALDEIDAALDRQEAERARLITRGIDMARLAGDAARAAELLVARADAEGGGRAAFGDLRAQMHDYKHRGHDKGILLDQQIAIALARIVLSRAEGPDEAGAALNSLGNALATLGRRESGTARLEEAVDAYRAALDECTRDRVPLDWATTQMNLGNALRTLGERESGTARLEEAVDAFRAALEEWTRDRVPLQWAMTQGNLGHLELAFARQTGDPAHLARALEHGRSAREVFDRAGASQYVAQADRLISAIETALSAGG